MEQLFSFEGVTVRVDDTTVLRDVTTTLPVGRLSVVAGVSGSGKTSLLRLCNRLDLPTTGEVLFRGTDLQQFDPLFLRRKVGMVFQRPVLFGGTVADNLDVAKPRATEGEMLSLLESVGLDSALLHRAGDDLSGGEAQRVCLARALLCEPEVLLMDEPTASLHPAASSALEDTVQQLNREQAVDVVWVTHDLAQIGRMAEHLTVMGDGRVIYAGDPDAPEAAAALATLSEEAS